MAMSLDAFVLRQLGPPPIPRIVKKATELFAEGDELVIPRCSKNLAARVAKFGWDPARLFQVLEESDGRALLSGSFLLGHLVNAKWEPGDIDVFGTKETLKALNWAFWPGDEDTTSSAYKNGARISVHNWVSSSTGTKLQLIVVPEGRVDEYVADFDLDLVKSTFDGAFIRVPKPTFDAIEAGGEEMLDKSFFQSDTLNQFTNRLDRLKKYVARGFTFHLPSSNSVDMSRWKAIKHTLPCLAKLYMPRKKQYARELAQYYKDRQAHMQKCWDEQHKGVFKSWSMSVWPRHPKLHIKLRSDSVLSK